MPGLPDVILVAPLGRLADTWLEVRYCRGVAFLSRRRLAMDHGGCRLVREVVARVRARLRAGPPRCRLCLSSHWDQAC
jgi:hypothetical protein